MIARYKLLPGFLALTLSLWVFNTQVGLGSPCDDANATGPSAASSIKPSKHDNEVVFDFETGNLQDWYIVEGSFGMLVCDREIFHTGGQYNKQGKYFLSTLETESSAASDAYTGVVESPLLILSAPEMSFLIGGGQTDATKVAICVVNSDGSLTEAATAHGDSTEHMTAIEWNKPELVGRPIVVRLIDKGIGGWGHITMDNFRAVGHIDEIATAQRRLVQYRKQIDFDGIHKTLDDLVANFGEDYTMGAQYTRQIDQYEKELAHVLADITKGDINSLDCYSKLKNNIEQFKNKVYLSNPLITSAPILFVTRNQYAQDHHNTATFFPSYNNEYNDGHFQPGGALKKLDVVTGTVTTLLDTSEGVIRDPEVYFEGKKIIFSMRRNLEDSYHIYEINADGSGLRQLTFAKSVDDIDPLYLPDDSIVFSSTREQKYCMCNKHLMCNLFKMGPDGENIHQIGKSTLFEGHSSLLPDGRILYDRWEYVDRNFGDAQGVWTVNPDGTDHAVYWGNNTNSPGAVLDSRAVPGTQMFIATFSSCHDRPWGAIALVDRRLGVDGKEPVIQTWPAKAIDLVGVGGMDTFVGVSPKHEDPYPLNDKYFLCSRMTGQGEQMGIFLIDIFGNETLIHTELPGCFDPMPLIPKLRPLKKPNMRQYSSDNPTGQFYVFDVYEGTHMKNVKRGDVKYLRVVESPEKRYRTMTAWHGNGTEWPAMNWNDFNNKRILGTVPVEEDGSAYFEIPAEKFIYFQLLDKNKQMIQSMRSGTIVQPGEMKGCIGCHENRTDSPAAATGHAMATAMQREPSQVNGWYGPARTFGFLKEVQPVFTANCVSCHDFATEGGAKAGLRLCADKSNTFNAAYNELWRKGYTGAIGAGPAEIQQAYSWGSHKSKLIATLKDDSHKDVKLTTEEFERIVTWIDINAPYYPEYSSAYPDNLAGRSPLANAQLNRLYELTGYNFAAFATCWGPNQGPLISYDRPELSPCLANLTGNEHAEALAIIKQGKENMSQNPRADMDGHIPCTGDQRREAWYQHRKKVEKQNRQAIMDGKKIYEK